MAATLSLTGPPDLDLSSASDLSVSSRSSNRSLRVAEKERKKKKAEDPFVLALKYFSDGNDGSLTVTLTHGYPDPRLPYPT